MVRELVICIEEIATREHNPELARKWLEDFPWMEAAINLIDKHLRVRGALAPTERLKLPTVLLVGPPGHGKTQFLRRVCADLNLPFAVYAAGSEPEGRSLSGSSRTWSTACPGLPLSMMARHAVANPAILVDDLCSGLTDSVNGAAQRVLLSMMEASRTIPWTCPFLGVPVDLSGINWLATANHRHRIIGPLLDRFRIVDAGAPKPEHSAGIVRVARSDFAERFSVPVERLPEPGRDLRTTVESTLAASGSLRQAYQKVESWLLDEIGRLNSSSVSAQTEPIAEMKVVRIGARREA